MPLCLSQRSARIEQAGGINLAQGVCDTPVPLPVREGASRGIENGINSYTRFDGLAELREAIAQKVRQYNGITADPETEIVVSAGSTGAFYCACLALLDPGDEVILFEPYYGYHVNTLLAVEAVPSYVTLRPPEWSFSMGDLERAATPRTKALVLNTPGNPSGKVFSRAELEAVAAFAGRHNLFVFTDEIYEHFLYDGRTHISPGCLKGMEERTITISGFSKTFSITGWRIGYSVSAARWARRIGHMNDLIYVCAPSPLQYGVAAGLSRIGRSFYEDLSLDYRKKRDSICDALTRAGLSPCVPQGAYYVLADTSSLPGNSGKEKAIFLLEQTGVASVPGEAFFHNGGGKNLVRFCFAKSEEDLHEACRRLKRLSSRPRRTAPSPLCPPPGRESNGGSRTSMAKRNARHGSE
ncbi:MAG: pyridoxal phosphate-dependent aminotransferase [Candidatus Acidiferrales bacterium]